MKHIKTAKLSQERATRVIEHSPLPLIMVNPDHTTGFMNIRFTEVFGYTIEDIPNVQIWFEKVFPDPEYRKMIISEWQSDVSKEDKYRSSSKPCKVTCKDSSVREVTIINSILDDGCYIVFFNDLTDLLRIEEEKRKLEAQLHQAQKMEAIGQLAGGIAHDFNNLLMIIMSSVSFISRDISDSVQSEDHLGNIKEASERAAMLTKQLLAFGRKQILEMSFVKINEFIDSFKGMINAILPENIKCSTDFAPELPEIKADVTQLQQIIINLILNARDAQSRGGEVCIRTSLQFIGDSEKQDLKSGQYVSIEVIDKGHGIPKTIIDKIFEPFFTTKAKEKGTGLGLSSVYGIVKQHEGSIEVESQPGLGTTFRILFPVVDELSDTVVEKEYESTSVELNCEILVVEDELLVRKSVVKLLTDNNIRVIEAETPEEAHDYVLKNPSRNTILLTDVVMPYISGKELYDRLLSIKPDLKVIYMSGYAADVITEHGIVEKGTFLISKPFTDAQLVSKIREAI